MLVWERLDKYIKTALKEIYFGDMDWVNVLRSYLGECFCINGVKDLG
jgi:hypothetical protein